MKQLLVLLLFILSTHAICGPKVLWWNIGYNEYAFTSTINKEQTQLDDTLQSYNWQKYDIVALGEYVEGTLNENSLVKLNKFFPFQKIIKYNDAYGKSIIIFSKTPFNFLISELDWTSPFVSEEVKKSYKKRLISKYGNMDTFIRKYIRITTSILDEEYHFVFYHLNNPWPKYYNQIGKYRTALEIIFGKNNPLYNQISNLKNSLSSDFGTDYKNENIIMMGDSNCPKDIKGITASCYEHLSGTLRVVEDDDNLITFPAKNSKVYKKFPSVKIDHVQVSTKLVDKTKTKVMSLIGSDHYPVELTIF